MYPYVNDITLKNKNLDSKEDFDSMETTHSHVTVALSSERCFCTFWMSYCRFHNCIHFHVKSCVYFIFMWAVFSLWYYAKWQFTSPLNTWRKHISILLLRLVKSSFSFVIYFHNIKEGSMLTHAKIFTGMSATSSMFVYSQKIALWIICLQLHLICTT